MCFAFKRNQPEERQQGPELGMAGCEGEAGPAGPAAAPVLRGLVQRSPHPAVVLGVRGSGCPR